MDDTTANCPRCVGVLRITQTVTHYGCDAHFDGELAWEGGTVDWDSAEFAESVCLDCDHVWTDPDELAAELLAAATDSTV